MASGVLNFALQSACPPAWVYPTLCLLPSLPSLLAIFVPFVPVLDLQGSGLGSGICHTLPILSGQVGIPG